MLPATPQRTAESLRVAPEPITEPETTCVVETGVTERVAAQSWYLPRPGRRSRRVVHLEDALTDCPDDAPTTDERAGADNEAARGQSPRARDVERLDRAVLVQRERYHTHRLLSVVGAVGEGDPRARGELTEPEGLVRESRRRPHEHPKDDDQERKCADEAEHRREEPGNDNLVPEAVPLDAGTA